MRQIQGMANPQQGLMQFLANSPQLKPVIDLLRVNNGNYQQAFYNYAKQCGVDPQ